MNASSFKHSYPLALKRYLEDGDNKQLDHVRDAVMIWETQLVDEPHGQSIIDNTPAKLNNHETPSTVSAEVVGEEAIADGL